MPIVRKVRDSGKIRWTQPFELVGCIAHGGTLPCEFCLDLETFPTWNLLGSATSVLELVELSSEISEILVLNPKTYLESFPGQAWVLYPRLMNRYGYLNSFVQDENPRMNW